MKNNIRGVNGEDSSPIDMVNNKKTETEFLAVATSVDEVYEKIRNEFGDNYEVVKKDTKMKYRFPFSWKKEYHYRAIMKNKVETAPVKMMDQKKKILDMLDNADKFQKHPVNSHEQTEISEIKSMLEEFKQSMQTQEKEEFLESEKEGVLKRYYESLITNEVEENYAKELVFEVKNKLSEKEWNNERIVKTKIEDMIKEKIKVYGSFERQNMQTLALIGPTGVGKTTTLVKIATSLKKGNKRIGLITTDNYRVAAFDQLKEYADKLGCPMIKSEPEELYDPIDVFKYQKGMDHILVDTSGRSPMNKGLINEIKSYLEVVQPDHVCLVLSSTQKYSDMLYTLKNYSEIKINSIIITKLDETMSYGFLYNILMKYDIPISYITNGQEVPDDIEIATKEYIAKRVVNGVGDDESSL